MARAVERYKSKKLLLNRAHLKEIRSYLNIIDFNEAELKLFRRSRSAIRKKNAVTIILLCTGIIVAAFSYVKFADLVSDNWETKDDLKDQIKKTKEITRKLSSANLFFSASKEPDRTIQFRLLEQAHQMDTTNPELYPMILDVTDPSRMDPTHVTLVGHKDEVVTVALSNDLKLALTGSLDSTAKLWDTKSGKEIKSFRHGSHVLSVCFSGDDRYVATADSDGTIMIGDTLQNDTTAKVKIDGTGGYVSSISFSNSGDTIFAGLANGMIKGWDWRNKHSVFLEKYHDDVVSKIRIIDNNILSSGHDGFIYRYDTIPEWEWDDGRKILNFDIKKINDDTTLTSFTSGNLAWVSINSDSPKPLSHPDTLYSLKFFHNEDWLATACHDGIARVWRTSEKKPSFTLDAHSGAVYDVDVSKDDNLLITGSMDKTAKIWYLNPWSNDSSKLNFIPTENIRQAFLSDDEKQLAIISSSLCILELFDLSEDTRKFSDTLPNLKEGFRYNFSKEELYGINNRDAIGQWGKDSNFSFQETPDYSLVPEHCRKWVSNKPLPTENSDSSADYSTVGSNIPTRLTSNLGSEQIISVGQFISHNNDCFFGTQEGQICKIKDGNLEVCIKVHNDNISQILLSPDARKWFTVAEDGEAYLWDYDFYSKTPLHTEVYDRIVCANFSDDGTKLIVGYENKSVKIWGTSSGEEIYSYNFHFTIIDAFFVEDGKEVLIVTKNSIHKYSIHIPDVVENFKTAFNPSELTNWEIQQYKIADILMSDGLDKVKKEGSEDNIYFLAEYLFERVLNNYNRKDFDDAISLYRHLSKTASFRSSSFYNDRAKELDEKYKSRTRKNPTGI